MQQLWTEENIKKFRELLEDTDFKETGLEDSWIELKETGTQKKEISTKNEEDRGEGLVQQGMPEQEKRTAECTQKGQKKCN